ncbi:MAG: hypothetical protein SGJ18_05595 [Pseudomonadota bacterium]|nr:hypothetical protein [Pseudomonadota bacterium]
MKNNEGSLFVVFLPLILTVMLVGATAVYLFSYHVKTKNACQQHLLRSQEILAEALTNLLNLNALASSLRLQEIETRAELAAAAPFPPVYTAVKARYLIVRLNQANLHLKQKQIIAEGQLKAILETAKLKQEFRYYSTVYSAAKNIALILNSPRLAVRATPPNGLAPNYSIVPFFSQTQKLTARWSIPIRNLLLTGLMPPFRRTDIFKLQCSATIEKRGQKWQSFLARDKS